MTMYQERITLTQTNVKHYKAKLNEHMKTVELAKKEFDKLKTEYEVLGLYNSMLKIRLQQIPAYKKQFNLYFLFGASRI